MGHGLYMINAAVISNVKYREELFRFPDLPGT
jgi:hypothetical protein